MSQKTVNFLGLALDDYIAARLLLRSGLLPQGVAVASTAVEKLIKALLALHGIFSKKHLDLGLLTKVRSVEPSLHDALNKDFIKFLGKGFMLRYASIDSGDFNIVINQYRTIMELDATVLTIDSGFRLQKDGHPIDTPLQTAIKARNPMIIDENVPLGIMPAEQLYKKTNKMHEIKIAKKLQTLTVQYKTEGLNVIGDFCKKTDIAFGKQQWQLALG